MTTPNPSNPPGSTPPPPPPAHPPTDLAGIGALLGRLDHKIDRVSKKLDAKPSRWEQILAFLIAVVLAATGAYFTSYFARRDIGPNTAVSERAKKDVETHANAVSLLAEVERNFEAFLISKGKEENAVDPHAVDLQKLIDSKAMDAATPSVDDFNDYVQQCKAKIKDWKQWKEDDAKVMQKEAKRRYETARKALSDWIETKRW
jgi:hypothetical protein